jgi:NhaP-type Na+/H+ or K+/H+ antiporter
MSQSRKGSAYEAVMNVLVGYTINMLANFAIFPLFGWQLSLSQNLQIGVIYTVVSLVRSYCIRRWFNGFKSKEAHE